MLLLTKNIIKRIFSVVNYRVVSKNTPFLVLISHRHWDFFLTHYACIHLNIFHFFAINTTSLLISSPHFYSPNPPSLQRPWTRHRLLPLNQIRIVKENQSTDDFSKRQKTRKVNSLNAFITSQERERKNYLSGLGSHLLD